MTTANTPVIDPAVYGTTTWVHLTCTDCVDEWMYDEDEGTVLRWPTITDAHRWLVNEASACDGAVLLTDAGLMLCRECDLKRQCLASGHDWHSRTTPCSCRGTSHTANIPCQSHDISRIDGRCVLCNDTGNRCSWAFRTCLRCGTHEDFNTSATPAIRTT